ncbi:hypothetical protein GQ55_1G332700 [Panicum hallii var. hallii]|uniref:Uncharacterized protein n=1 Tax=Panicum hallii var. hallii TaxID=1504633 RepID=A0A2T7FA60_9POAL|nr:hypothetical protein GQ55_1G332700 [Panicum hallii var. hallii]
MLRRWYYNEQIVFRVETLQAEAPLPSCSLHIGQNHFISSPISVYISAHYLLQYVGRHELRKTEASIRFLLPRPAGLAI